MKLSTKYFGEIDYGDEDVIRFPQGIFAFEEEKEFLLLPFSGSDGTLLCLQSVATPQLAFVVMNPFALHLEYAPVLQPVGEFFYGTDLAGQQEPAIQLEEAGLFQNTLLDSQRNGTVVG